MRGHLFNILILERLKQNAQALPALASLTPLRREALFLILKHSGSESAREDIYNLLALIQPDNEYSNDELLILLTSIARFKADALPPVAQELLKALSVKGSLARALYYLTDKLPQFSEEEFNGYLRLIPYVNWYNREGIIALPKEMTFGIELEVAYKNRKDSAVNLEKTKALLTRLQEFAREKKLLQRGWKVKSDGNNVEITTGDGGFPNTALGFRQLREGLSLFRGEIIKLSEGFNISQGMHIHIGYPGKNIASLMGPVSFIGKSMEYLWSGLSENNNIITFADGALFAGGLNKKNKTPFYYAPETDTIALNTFAPAYLGLPEESYFEQLQAAVGVAMNIVYSAATRADELNILSNGLPIYQYALYTPRNSYLLRKHIARLFGANKPGIIAALGLLLAKKRLPRLIVSEAEYEDTTDIEIKRFYQGRGLSLLYELHRSRNGWNPDIKRDIEALLEDESMKEELIALCGKLLEYLPLQSKDSNWVIQLAKKMQEQKWIEHYLNIIPVAYYKELRTLYGHTDFVRSLAYSPDGLYLASGSDDGTIKLWVNLKMWYEDEKKGESKIGNDIVSSAVEARAKDALGGIAFNALPIRTESVASSALGSFTGVKAFQGDLDAEWAQIQAVFNAGIRPSVQRISKYTAAAASSGLAGEKIDQVRSMLADILRRDEEDKKLSACSADLKNLVTALES